MPGSPLLRSQSSMLEKVAGTPCSQASAPTAELTGIKIGNGWIHALYEGQHIAGLSYHQSRQYDDRGRRWLWVVINSNWGPEIATKVLSARAILEG